MPARLEMVGLMVEDMARSLSFYRGHRAPFETHFGTHMAMINDPDGNAILLTAG
jgi:hypothetical protein